MLLWILAIVLVVLGALVILFFPRIFAELRYPLAYEDLIKREAAAHDLDPFLVAAVIRSESGFNPNATSPAGARGLMQLMPLTAQGIARRLGESDFTVDKLYDPERSIRYGTYHLQGLMGRYDSDLEPAIVAYNGGGGAGDRYQAGDRSTVPTESLNYVKKVIAAKAAYEELYPVRLGTGKSLQDFFQPAEQQNTLSSLLLKAVQGAVASKLGAQ
ncbi:lytic transglycosylase domain-containing protein [Candidatus Berkelbacteria bacterium]|nr:lytic transglycosylase domain-containing protein [Candidatus Berkelbacteria bacterium]